MRWTGPIENGLKELLNPEDICVVSSAVDPTLKEMFFALSLSRMPTNLLVCSQYCEPVSRILVLNQPSDVPYRFLHSAAQLCRRLRATPLVLTVAHSESLVRASEHQAENIFGCEQVPATFDFVVSSDVANSVALITRLRQCTHLFIGKPSLPSWVYSFRWTLMESLLRQLGLTCLALPDSVDQGQQMFLDSPRNRDKTPERSSVACKAQAASQPNMDRNNREVESVQF
jgi:K+-sensing histidine kinase KdpD